MRFAATLVAGLLALAGGAFAAEAARPPDFRRLPPFASVRTAAAAAGIDLAGIGAPLERTDLRPGDRVAVLISLVDGRKLQQWIMEVESVESTEKERQGGAASVYHTSSGHELRFATARTAVALKIVGPLTEGVASRGAPPLKRARTTVAADFLSLGLNRPAELNDRVRRMRAENPSLPRANFSVGPSPFPADVVARDRVGAEAVGITEADERAVIGSVLALIEFFQIARRTPGLQDILLKVVDVPWWSIIKSARAPDVGFELSDESEKLAPADWNLGERPAVWAVPQLLTINNKPAMRMQLAVVEPRPPLLPCAGIVGIAAARPDGKGPVVMLQVIAARGAGTEAAATPASSAL